MENRNLPNWKRLKLHKMNWETFYLRAEILKAVRSFFDRNGFLEVETPILTPFPTLDSNIQPMVSIFHNDQNSERHLYMHTSPEHAMKKLLCADAQKIYYCGRVFRDGELTPLHNPEFTLVEWYRTNATYTDMQHDIQNLIRLVAKKVFNTEKIIYNGTQINLGLSWEETTVCDLFQKHTGVDLNVTVEIEQMRAAAKKLDISFHKEDDWETLFYRIFLEKIESHLGFPKPIFIKDYPLKMALMAKKKTEDTHWVERIELFIAGLELANGYTELTDPVEQNNRFLHDQHKKLIQSGCFYPIDTELISAFEMGLPPCAGIALGFDRLVMLMLDKTKIDDVILFPFSQLQNQAKQTNSIKRD